MEDLDSLSPPIFTSYAKRYAGTHTQAQVHSCSSEL